MKETIIKLFFAATLFAAALSSCTKDPLPQKRSKNIGVTTNLTDPATKADGSHEIGRRTIQCDGFTVEEIAYDSYYDLTTSRVDTKASIIDNTSIKTVGFTMDAYTEVDIRNGEQNLGNHPFNNAAWTYGSSWTCNQAQNWSNDNEYKIWSWYGVDKLTKDGDNRTISFTQGTGDNMKDVLVAYNSEKRTLDSNGECANPNIDIKFKHILAAVVITADNLPSKYTITSIEIGGVATKVTGTLTPDAIDNFTGGSLYSNGSSTNVLTPSGSGSFSATGLSLSNGSGECVFLMIPQTLSTGSYIKWTIEGNGISVTRKANFSSALDTAKHDWQSGRKYCYNIGVIGGQTVTYEFTSNDWKAIRTLLPDGTTDSSGKSGYWSGDSGNGSSGLSITAKSSGFLNFTTNSKTITGTLKDELLTKDGKGTYITGFTLTYELPNGGTKEISIKNYNSSLSSEDDSSNTISYSGNAVELNNLQLTAKVTSRILSSTNYILKLKSISITYFQNLEKDNL